MNMMDLLTLLFVTLHFVAMMHLVQAQNAHDIVKPIENAEVRRRARRHLWSAFVQMVFFFAALLAWICHLLRTAGGR